MKNLFWIFFALISILSSCAAPKKTLIAPKDRIAQDINNAHNLYEMGEVHAAIANISHVVEKYAYKPAHDKAYELLIEWLLEVNNYAEAKRYASYFLQHYPKSPSAQKISALFKSKAIYEKAHEKEPEPALEPEQENLDLNLDGEKKKSFHKEPQNPVDMQTLGILLPLSGPLANFGYKALVAMSLALKIDLPEQINKIGEVTSSGLRIIIADSRGEAERTAELTSELISKYHVALIVGDISNDASLIAAQICEQQQVPLISLSRHPLVADLGAYIFMFSPSYNQHIDFLVNHAMNKLGFKNFAILYPRHNYGISMAKAFYEAVIKAGGEIKALEAYDAHETTFTSVIKNLAGLYCVKKPCDEKNLTPIIDFEALFIPEFAKLAYLVPALVQADILVTNSPEAHRAYARATKIEPKAVQLLGPSSWNDPATLHKIGSQANGAFFVDFVSFEDSPELRNFKNEWLNLNLSHPTTNEVLAYDAAAMALKILESKVSSRDKMRLAIANFDAQAGLLKNIKFSPEGELIIPSLGFSLAKGQRSTYE